MKRAWCGLVAAATLAAACGGANPAAPTAGKQAQADGKPAAQASRNDALLCQRKHPDTGARRIDLRRQGASVAVAQAGDKTIAYVADSDDHSLQTYDVDSAKLLAVTPLGSAPEQVLVLADGRVAVTMRQKNRVQILEPAARADQPLTGLCAIRTPVEPVAMALTPNDRRLLVTSAFGRKLTAYDTKTGAKRFSKQLAREPRAVVVDDDGKRAFVAHVVGGHVSVVDLDRSSRHEDAVREIDMRVPKLFGRSGNDPLRASCQGFALAKSIMPVDPGRPQVPSGKVFAPRVTIEGGEPTVRTSGYGGSRFREIEAPMVSVLDSRAERAMTTALVSDTSRSVPQRGRCLLPRSAAVSGATGGLLMTCLGNDVVVEVDARGFDPARLERRRWDVPAGPTGIALDDAKAKAVVWSQFDRRLSVIDLKGKDGGVETVAAPVLSKSQNKNWAWGRVLFHRTDDTRISRDGRACASCHPDGREDALTWSTPVGPRQTIMLAGSRVKASAPFSWLGQHESLKVHLESTFQRLGGTGLNDAPKGDSDLDALITYIKDIPGPQLSDHLVDRRQAKLATRGKALFFAKEQGCASCHVGAGGIDKAAHDVGSRGGGDVDAKFDTPSLRFVGGTAPYFHDGRYTTLMDMLMATDANMGHTMHLSRSDARALAAYLETL